MFSRVPNKHMRIFYHNWYSNMSFRGLPKCFCSESFKVYVLKSFVHFDTCAVEKLVPDPFLKNRNWAYRLINSLKFYTICFYCMSRSRTNKYIETMVLTTWSYKVFFKKRGLKLPSLPHFLHDFGRKIFF